MKKRKIYKLNRFVAALLTAIFLFALSTCNTPESIKTTEQTIDSGAKEAVNFATFKKSLGDLIGEAGGFEMALTDSSESDDGATVHFFDITYDLVYSQERMMLLVFCDTDDQVTGVSCRAVTYTSNVNIALIGYYVYKSLGLSVLDADAFYNSFAFFEDAPEEEYEREENGWLMETRYQEDSVTFHAIQLNTQK